MKNIYLLGECMIELMNTSVNTMKQSFAGDVYNTAVYLKRTFPQTNVHLVTAVGTDRFSQNMIACFKDENIQSDLVFQSKTKRQGFMRSISMRTASVVLPIGEKTQQLDKLCSISMMRP